MKKSRATRWVSLLLIPMLALLFMQPSPVSADAHSFSLTKTFSNPFACNAVPTTPTFPATQSPAPGQCVEVQLTITNTSTSANAITSFTLTDNLPTALSGQGTTCFVSGNPMAAAPTTATCTITSTGFSFSTTTANIGMNQSVAVMFVAMVAQNAACSSSIQNTASATASGGGAITFTGNNATGNLTVQCPTAITLTASKAVSVNGAASSTTGTAHPNDTLTYTISVKNNSTTSSVSGVTISDTIQGGQTLNLNGITGTQAFTCSYNSTTRMLTCTTPTLGAGVTAQLVFSTAVGNTTSTIPNTATITSTTGPSATTNTTQVTVTSVTPIVTGGSVLVCGLVSGFVVPTATTAGTIMIGGLTIPIAASATITASAGFALVNGANTCATITLTNGQATVISAALNAPTVAMVCGTFTTSTTAGFIFVGGFPVQVVGGGTFVGLTVNTTFCFLLSNGQAFAVLTTIPTSAHPLKRHGYAYRESFTRAE